VCVCVCLCVFVCVCVCVCAGEANLLEASIQRTNVVCYDFSELWCLEKRRLDDILLRFPKVKKGVGFS
jgi:hypothetical protein